MFCVWRTQTFQGIMAKYRAGRTAFWGKEHCTVRLLRRMVSAQLVHHQHPGPGVDSESRSAGCLHRVPCPQSAYIESWSAGCLHRVLLRWNGFNIYTPCKAQERYVFLKPCQTDNVLILSVDVYATLDHTLNRNHDKPHQSANEL